MTKSDNVLFPITEPFNSGFLNVGDGHEIYFEQVGNPAGIPIVFLHGGPGGGGNPDKRKWFDPQKFNAVLFDQRGCGRSKAADPLKFNTTQHLVNDIEMLRVHLKISQWHVFGGSWGSTLALIYAQQFAENVLGILTHGVWGCRQHEIDWIFSPTGAQAAVFPDEYAVFRNAFPLCAEADIAAQCYHDILHGTKGQQRHAAVASSRWQYAGMNLELQDWENPQTEEEWQELVLGEQIFANYFINNFFIFEGLLFEEHHLAAIKDIPTTIIQGRYDMCCPPKTAFELHQKLPKSTLQMVMASHRTGEPALTQALLQALKEIK